MDSAKCRLAERGETNVEDRYVDEVGQYRSADLFAVLFPWEPSTLRQDEENVSREMHELSIALSIVDGVLEELRTRGVNRASVVHLRVGKLSGVDTNALQFSYGLACQQTVLAESRLAIEDVDVTVFCEACGLERPVRTFPILSCAECGASSQRAARGKNWRLQEWRSSRERSTHRGSPAGSSQGK